MRADLHQMVLDYIHKKGVTKRAFANEVGVSEDRFYKWCNGKLESNYVDSVIGDFFKKEMEKNKKIKYVEVWCYVYSDSLRKRIPEYRDKMFKKLVGVEVVEDDK